MLLVFKWGLKWEPGRYFREPPGPEGRSSRSPCCTITVRLDEDGDMENMIVCVSWWGRHKENATQMMYAGEPVRIVGKSVCACVCCEISSCIQMSPFFSCLHKRRREYACVCDVRTGESKWSCASQCNSFKWTSVVIIESLFLPWNTINSSHRDSVFTDVLFLLLSLRPCSLTVLERQTGLKWLSSTSNFTARHNTQTIPLRSAWLDPFALDTSSAYWLMGLISESGGALRHQSLSSPYLFSEPVIPCYDSSRKASLDRERERAAEQKGKRGK